MARCCSNLFWNGLTDIPPVLTDPPDTESLNFYYTNLSSISRSVMYDEVNTVVFSIDGSHPPDYVAASTFLQGYAGAESGLFQNPLTGEIFVWVALTAEPIGWTWDADIFAPNPVPVVWTNGGAVTLQCFNSGILAYDPATYTMTQFYTTGVITNGSLDPTTTYSDPAFNSVYDQSVMACFGANAVIAVTVGVGTIIVQIRNTYCPLVAIKSYDGVTTYTDTLLVVPC